MSEKERFKPYVAAYLALTQNDQVLLLRRFNTGYQDGNYSLIAGRLDGGETTKQCIIREAAEEAGIQVNPEDLEVAHVAHRLTPAREYFDIYLRTEKWTGEITNMELDKCDELKWHDLENLPDNILPEVKLALQSINQKIHFGEFGWEG
ncbi:NUDIX hydrolase [Candidatus Peregrinibacteria bacterium HGW-Peregrinibacteria-1]|jgi:8-oxo-dGTP pyrophosphatase MutT (NUDIX family)|nr:MAG: NUDIX hydrolase [Candidatus Peregrinibacteria bacterium HGW-Peregrinibacteria-1]